MFDREMYERLLRIQSEQWDLQEVHRDRGEWASYWAVRRQWITTGRLVSQLYLERQAEVEPQLQLLDPDAGRRHDRLA